MISQILDMTLVHILIFALLHDKLFLPASLYSCKEEEEEEDFLWIKIIIYHYQGLNVCYTITISI